MMKHLKQRLNHVLRDIQSPIYEHIRLCIWYPGRSCFSFFSIFDSKKRLIALLRQPCPWDITLNRLRETEIELEEKTKLDHSFVSIDIHSLRTSIFHRSMIISRYARDFFLWRIVTYVIRSYYKVYDVSYVVHVSIRDAYTKLIYVT